MIAISLDIWASTTAVLPEGQGKLICKSPTSEVRKKLRSVRTKKDYWNILSMMDSVLIVLNDIMMCRRVGLEPSYSIVLRICPLYFTRTWSARANSMIIRGASQSALRSYCAISKVGLQRQNTRCLPARQIRSRHRAREVDKYTFYLVSNNMDHGR